MDMLSKKVMHSGKDSVTIVLYAYRASARYSTGEYPFILLYDRDSVLPTTEMLESPQERDNIDDNYTREITLRISTAWRTA